MATTSIWPINGKPNCVKDLAAPSGLIQTPALLAFLIIGQGFKANIINKW